MSLQNISRFFKEFKEKTDSRSNCEANTKSQVLNGTR